MAERNFKLHLLSAALVTGFGFYFGVSIREWQILILCTGGVLCLEIVNTALEKLVDLVSPEFNPLAGAVKDIAAAGVLVFSAISAIIAATIFMPYFFK